MDSVPTRTHGFGSIPIGRAQRRPAPSTPLTAVAI